MSETITARGAHRFRRPAAVTAAALAVAAVAVPAGATTYTPISIAGSTWANNAFAQWQAAAANAGMTVDYSATGTLDGDNQFAQGTVDAGATDAPYGSDPWLPQPQRPYELVPMTAGAVTFAYHLTGTDGKPIPGLKLSSSLIAKIFTGAVTQWDDPQIAAENPGALLPSIPVVPVVRKDSTATTLRFTQWLSQLEQNAWQNYCTQLNHSPCGPTALFPASAADAAMTGATGAAGYVAQTAGAIGYVEESYAMNQNLPVAKVLNLGGYYVAPTAGNVAVGLQSAPVDTTGSVNLDKAALSTDPRSYPLSMVSYLAVPTSLTGTFTADKGTTLAEFIDSADCAEQNILTSLGYVPLTGNLVSGAMAATAKIPVGPGFVVPTVCTYVGDSLAAADPMPPLADKGSPLPPGPPAESLGTLLPPGALAISVAAGQVTLPSPILDSTATDFHTSGQMAPLTVIDTRAGAPGWTISGQVGDFTDGVGHSIAGEALSWHPQAIDATGPTVSLGPVVAVGAGGLKTVRTLASGTGLGTAHLGAELDLDAPTTTVAGTYTTTLTITAI